MKINLNTHSYKDLKRQLKVIILMGNGKRMSDMP